MNYFVVQFLVLFNQPHTTHAAPHNPRSPTQPTQPHTTHAVPHNPRSPTQPTQSHTNIGRLSTRKLLSVQHRTLVRFIERVTGLQQIEKYTPTV